MPVGIVTIHTVHLPFQHRMVRRQAELRVTIDVTMEASVGGNSWIYDEAIEARAATGLDVFAPRSVTGLTASCLPRLRLCQMDPRMDVPVELLADVVVAACAALIAHISGTWHGPDRRR